MSERLGATELRRSTSATSHRSARRRDPRASPAKPTRVDLSHAAARQRDVRSHAAAKRRAESRRSQKRNESDSGEYVTAGSLYFLRSSALRADRRCRSVVRPSGAALCGSVALRSIIRIAVRDFANGYLTPTAGHHDWCVASGHGGSRRSSAARTPNRSTPTPAVTPCDDEPAADRRSGPGRRAPARRRASRHSSAADRR